MTVGSGFCRLLALGEYSSALKTYAIAMIMTRRAKTIFRLLSPPRRPAKIHLRFMRKVYTRFSYKKRSGQRRNCWERKKGNSRTKAQARQKGNHILAVSCFFLANLNNGSALMSPPSLEPGDWP